MSALLIVKIIFVITVFFFILCVSTILVNKADHIRPRISATKLIKLHFRSYKMTDDGYSDKMHSHRRETALQGALEFWPKVEDRNWETIFYGHYRPIFNHCDIIGLKIYRIR